MKNIEFKIVKKNRIWIEAIIGASCKAKLKMSEETKELVEGESYSLMVEDISIRSKYGCELRYEVKKVSKEKIFLKARYNTILVDECKSFGGLWDGEEKVWVFDEMMRDKVETLEERFAGEEIAIEITLKDDEINASRSSLNFIGYPLCYATGRDSGAKASEGVALIAGKITSTGSIQYWYTTAYKGVTFRLYVSKAFLDEKRDSYSERWDIKELEKEM